MPVSRPLALLPGCPSLSLSEEKNDLDHEETLALRECWDGVQRAFGAMAFGLLQLRRGAGKDSLKETWSLLFDAEE
jgi:hypothetical protein